MVTGAAGFIGSAVVRALLAREAEVVALVEPDGDVRNLEGLEVEQITVDVRDADAVTKSCDGARVHLSLGSHIPVLGAPRPKALL